MKQKIYLILLFIIVLMFQGRNIDSSIFNQYDWRQWDTFSVIKNFRQEGMNILTPRTNQIYVEGRGTENRLFLLDFPLYPYLSALVSFVSGITPFAPRLVNVFLAASISIVIFLLGKKIKNPKAGIIAVILTNISPLFQYSVNAMQPDMFMLFFLILFIYFSIDRSFNSKAIAALTIAVAIKPYVVLVVLPFTINKYIESRKKEYLMYLLIPLFAYGVWFLYGYETASGKYWYTHQQWVLTFVNSWRFDLKEIAISFLKDLSFYTVTIPLILYAGVGFNFLEKDKKKVFHLLLIGILSFFILLLPGNYNHTYYQLLLLPFVYLLAGVGIQSTISRRNLAIFLILSPLYILPSKNLYQKLFKEHQIYKNLNGWQFTQNVIPEDSLTFYYNEEMSPVLLNMMDRNGYVFPVTGIDCEAEKQKIKHLSPTHALIFKGFINRENQEKISDTNNVVRCLVQLGNEKTYENGAVTVFKLN